MLKFSLEGPRATTANAAGVIANAASLATVQTNISTPSMNTGKWQVGGVRDDRIKEGMCCSADIEKAKFERTGGGTAFQSDKVHEPSTSTVLKRGATKQEESEGEGEVDGEWGGLTWDEDEIGEVDSLGALGGSLGTVEVASEHGEVSHEDLLIRVKGAADTTEVRRSVHQVRRENVLRWFKIRLRCVTSERPNPRGCLAFLYVNKEGAS